MYRTQPEICCNMMSGKLPTICHCEWKEVKRCNRKTLRLLRFARNDGYFKGHHIIPHDYQKFRNGRKCHNEGWCSTLTLLLLPSELISIQAPLEENVPVA